jgi:hypothetical protein
MQLERLRSICLALLGSATLLAAAPAFADSNPLLGKHTQAVALSDSALAKVKGSGGVSYYYGYFGAIYAYDALLYGTMGEYYNYYNGTGTSSTAYTMYVNAYNSASQSATYYYYAIYYASIGY